MAQTARPPMVGDVQPSRVEGLDAANVVAVLPVGAVESHGPHLPVAVDALLNDALWRSASPNCCQPTRPSPSSPPSPSG